MKKLSIIQILNAADYHTHGAAHWVDTDSFTFKFKTDPEALSDAGDKSLLPTPTKQPSLDYYN